LWHISHISERFINAVAYNCFEDWHSDPMKIPEEYIRKLDAEDDDDDDGEDDDDDDDEEGGDDDEDF